MWRCNKAWFLKKTLSSGKSLYIYKYLFIFNLIVTLVGRIEGGRLFEVGANSMLGAYSNKYGDYCIFHSLYLMKMSCRKHRRWHFQDSKFKNFLAEHAPRLPQVWALSVC